MTTDTAAKVRENRLRRAAARQRVTLTKVRRRDPRAWDYGMFTLTHSDTGEVIAETLTLDQVEAWLTGGTPTTAKD